MRQWVYKTDDKGRPRRFTSHREAIGWAALKVGRYAGPVVGLGAAALIFDPEGLGREFILLLTLMVVVLCAAVVALLYAYVALSGGVMGSDERRAHLEELRESRRGRW
jgi:hypothetical protein